MRSKISSTDRSENKKCFEYITERKIPNIIYLHPVSYTFITYISISTMPSITTSSAVILLSYFAASAAAANCNPSFDVAAGSDCITKCRQVSICTSIFFKH